MKITRGLYSTFLTLLAPVLLWKSHKETTELNNFSERLGYTPSLPIKPAIWLHAASVGEVIAATPLIDRLLQQYDQHQLIVTTMTATGARQARKALKGKGVQLMVPIDLPWVATRFLDKLKPEVAIFMETEIWPNLMHACQEREIPPGHCQRAFVGKIASGISEVQRGDSGRAGRSLCCRGKVSTGCSALYQLGCSGE